MSNGRAAWIRFKLRSKAARLISVQQRRGPVVSFLEMIGLG